MNGADQSDSTPICRCRVLYLGSAVPTVTKDGLQGIQEPLRELYPENGIVGARGIDSWLSVWSNGILLENMDENNKKISRFFPIESLHYCAAVRYVVVPVRNKLSPRFLPLISPFARAPNSVHPPLFAAILRRTSGIKVLECHVFICKREIAANALVRCCFHAYSDSLYAAKQLQITGSSVSHNQDLEATKWNPMSRASSTATIDTLNENHKIWTASSDDNLNQSSSDSLYDTFSLANRQQENQTLPRRRQISSPITIPTPPEVPTLKKKKKSKTFDNISLSYQPHMRSAPSLIHQASTISPPLLAQSVHPPVLIGPKFFKNNTFAYRKNRSRVIVPRPIAPPYVPIIFSSKKMEPIYGYPPNHSANASSIPYANEDAILLRQYGTMNQMARGYNNRSTVDVNDNGDYDENDANMDMKMDESAQQSPFNTGIYKRKGHLNERAFSYSIRQEHRSRSYGSLANLKFAASTADLNNELDSKKEQEIIQMVNDLDLHGDRLERSEVPHGMYDNKNASQLILVNGNRA